MATQEPTTPPRPPNDENTLFQELERYPWDSDPEFQGGLQAILGPNPSPDQAEQLTLRARCFYFARKNHTPIDFNAYHAWRSQRPSSSLPNGTSSEGSVAASIATGGSASDQVPARTHEASGDTYSSEPPAPYPTTFSHIVELITNGQPIPGVKEVPDTVLEGQASQATTVKRRKPWEKDDIAAAG